jgi:hypothetical protein
MLHGQTIARCAWIWMVWKVLLQLVLLLAAVAAQKKMMQWQR